MRKETYLAGSLSLINLILTLIRMRGSTLAQAIIGFIGLSTLVVLIYLLFRDSMSTWSESYHRLETDRKLQINDKFKATRCSYCGKYEPNINKSTVSLGYCSRSCRIAANRRILLLLGNIILFFPTTLSPPSILTFSTGLILIIIGIKAMELHYPEFVYRNIDQQSKTGNEVEKTKLTHFKKGTDNLVRVEKLDLSVRVCCYQTARLKEQYCGCGRAVPPELIEFLDRI